MVSSLSHCRVAPAEFSDSIRSWPCLSHYSSATSAHSAVNPSLRVNGCVKLEYGWNLNRAKVSHKLSPCAGGTTSACFLMPLRGTRHVSEKCVFHWRFLEAKKAHGLSPFWEGNRNNRANNFERGEAMIRNKLCGGIIRGSPCSYPISVEEGPDGQYEYKDNNPRSTDYGKDIHVCPRCGERLYLWTEHSDHLHPRW